MSDQSVGTISALVGSAISATLTILDDQGNPVTTWTGGTSLSAQCSTGGTTASLFSPTVTWLNASLGQISLSISGAQTTSLTPGDYRVYLTINGTYTRPIAILTLDPAPGSSPEPAVYCTLADMHKLASGWIEELMKFDSEESNFTEERALARQWLDNIVGARVLEILTDQSQRHGPILPVPPIFPTTGYDGGPAWGPSTIPDQTLITQQLVFLGYLNSNYLMRRNASNDPNKQDNGRVERITAHYALHLVLDNQLGDVNETPYQVLADKHLKRAVRMIAGWTALLDVNADGIPDFTIE